LKEAATYLPAYGFSKNGKCPGKVEQRKGSGGRRLRRRNEVGRSKTLNR
jgi:hypothetical protein